MSTYFHFIGVDSRVQCPLMGWIVYERIYIINTSVVFFFTNGETQTMSIEKSMVQ